jgi:hypothetical protein
MINDLLQPILGHHATEAREMVATPVEMLEVKRDPCAFGRSADDPQSLWNYLFANSIAGDNRNAQRRHGTP